MLYLDIFNSNYIERTPTSGIVYPQDINYLRRLYQFNLEAIQTYYLDRNFAVKNTHILSRILEHFPLYFSYEDYRYLEFAEERVKYLAKHFKFTSEIEKGIVHQSYFFGNQGEDIIIADYDHFSIADTVKNWETVSCIEIMKHNRNDTKLLLPLYNDDGSRSGLNVIRINIPMLAFKYREFMRKQSRATEGEMVLNKNYFVIKNVLPGALPTLIDHVFLNKLMDKFYGREEVVPQHKHRFRIFEPTIQINRYIENTLDVITSKRLDFVNLLRNIQLMFSKDASELLGIKELSLTRQIRWSILASRIDYMIFMLDVSKSLDMNRHYLNDWKRFAIRMINDKSLFNGMFSYEIEKDIEEKIKRLSEL